MQNEIAPFGPKTHLWPEGCIPDFQPHQIAATTEEAAAPGFDPDASRMPHIQWYPSPDPAVATDACAIITSGGGYDCCCDLPAYKPLVAEFLRAGVHCVNFTYRTPRPKGIPIYKTAWEDARRAIRIVRAQAAARGIDPAKIGAMSCSAGSHLALLMALSSRSPAPYSPVDALDAEDAPLAWLVAFCPAYVLTDGLDCRNTNGGEGATVDSIFAFDEASCPICFFHGGADPYSPLGSTKIWRLLSKKGIHSELHLDATRGHGPITAEPFRLHAIGFLRRIGILPALPTDATQPPELTDAEALAAVEEWEASRRNGTPHDLHLVSLTKTPNDHH